MVAYDPFRRVAMMQGTTKSCEARHLENHLNLAEYQLPADLDGEYTFPPQLCPTTEKPDIVIWNERAHCLLHRKRC